MTPRPPKIHAPLEYEFDEVLEAIADEFKPGIKSATARPFVKWAGGKRSIVPELLARMPETYKTYCELFLGGAALYYAVRPQQSYLSDINFPLVLTYLAVRDKVDELIAELKIHATKHNKDYYYKQRIRLSQEHTASKIGALLIYLNKSCYNGLYRVNKSGEYNVPMGSYTDPAILDEENLRAYAINVIVFMDIGKTIGQITTDNPGVRRAAFLIGLGCKSHFLGKLGDVVFQSHR